MSTKGQETKRSWFFSVLEEDFIEVPQRVYELCSNENGEPIFGRHIDIMLEALGVNLPAKIFVELNAFYVYLTAYYFLLDGAHDGHLKQKDDLLYVTHLSFGFNYHLHNLLGLQPEFAARIVGLVKGAIRDNRTAIIEADRCAASPERVEQDAEFRHIIGRSNSFLLLLAICQVLSGVSHEEMLRSVAEQFIFVMQLGDDLGDWREDYFSGRWTPFLKRIHAEGRPFRSIEELEEIVYFDGFYEREALMIIRELRSLRSRVLQLLPKPLLLLDLLDRQIAELRGLLFELISVKSGPLVALSRGERPFVN